MINFISPFSKLKLVEAGEWLISENEKFPIINGIPRFVPNDTYASAFGLQWNSYKRTQLDSYTKLDISKTRLERCLGLNLVDLKDMNILEAGCGPGRFTELFVQHGANTHSFDLSNAVDANRANLGIHQNHQLCQADIYHIPYPEESFDIVCCLGVVQHTPNSEKTIQHLWKMVKPGGCLVFDHYKWRLGYYSTLKPVYRFFLKSLKPEKSIKIIDKLVDFFFPIQWSIRNIKWLHSLVNRFTPLIVYYYEIPELPKEEQLIWAKMDTMDSNTDYYKHLLTPKQIQTILHKLVGRDIWLNVGGNGIEARAYKVNQN